METYELLDGTILNLANVPFQERVLIQNAIDMASAGNPNKFMTWCNENTVRMGGVGETATRVCRDLRARMAA